MTDEFHEDVMGHYFYDKGTNEVTLCFSHQSHLLEASVLIEALADLIKAVSKVQSLGVEV